jgi:hypothetical protein
MNKPKDKSAAVVTVFRADEMTSRGRKQVAAWLRQQASMLEKEGKNYAKRFTGRYLYAA